MYDLNDAQPQMPPVGELIPDGTFARVAMTIRPGGLNGATPADAGVLKASHSSDAKLAQERSSVLCRGGRSAGEWHGACAWQDRCWGAPA